MREGINNENAKENNVEQSTLSPPTTTLTDTTNTKYYTISSVNPRPFLLSNNIKDNNESNSINRSDNTKIATAILNNNNDNHMNLNNKLNHIPPEITLPLPPATTAGRFQEFFHQAKEIIDHYQLICKQKEDQLFKDIEHLKSLYYTEVIELS